MNEFMHALAATPAELFPTWTPVVAAFGTPASVEKWVTQSRNVILGRPIASTALDTVATTAVEGQKIDDRRKSPLMRALFSAGDSGAHGRR